MTPAAFIDFADGAEIFLAFLVVFGMAVVFGLYSRGGSAINQRAYNKRYSNAPGAYGPSTLGNDRIAAQRLTRGTK